MYAYQLRNILSGKRALGSSFSGIYPSDRLPSKVSYPSAFVFNTAPHYCQEGHWVALYINTNGRGEYFDSFGVMPPPPIQTFLSVNTFSWRYNHIKLQADHSLCCGEYCFYYLMHRSKMNTSYDNIMKHFFVGDCDRNDEIVMNFFEKYI